MESENNNPHDDILKLLEILNTYTNSKNDTIPFESIPTNIKDNYMNLICKHNSQIAFQYIIDNIKTSEHKLYFIEYYAKTLYKDTFKNLYKNIDINIDFNDVNPMTIEIIKFIKDIYPDYDFKRLFIIDKIEVYNYLIDNTNFDPLLINEQGENILYKITKFKTFKYIFEKLNTKMLHQLTIQNNNLFYIFENIGFKFKLIMYLINAGLNINHIDSNNNTMLKYIFNYQREIMYGTIVYLYDINVLPELINCLISNNPSQLLLRQLYYILNVNYYHLKTVNMSNHVIPVHNTLINLVYDQIELFDIIDYNTRTFSHYRETFNNLDIFKQYLNKINDIDLYNNFDYIVNMITKYYSFKYLINNYNIPEHNLKIWLKIICTEFFNRRCNDTTQQLLIVENICFILGEVKISIFNISGCSCKDEKCKLNIYDVKTVDGFIKIFSGINSECDKLLNILREYLVV